MSGSYESAVLGDRFRLNRPPTLLTRTASIAPIGFTRLRSEMVGHDRTKDVPAEDAFAFHVLLQPVSADIWIDGRRTALRTVKSGALLLFDLSRNAVSNIHTPFDILRFYISQSTLDELAFDRGVRRSVGFARPCFGSNDSVMHGLANALLDGIERPSECSALFIDHIGLAFHAHATEVYGHSAVRRFTASGGLAPWQVRRTVDFMVGHLDGDPTIAELAKECRLSAGYFARAFRQSTGLSPHQFLMRKRIERSQELLLCGELDLADIAMICGFMDQSHFTRVFGKFEGHSPGKWQRLNRK